MSKFLIFCLHFRKKNSINFCKSKKTKTYVYVNSHAGSWSDFERPTTRRGNFGLKFKNKIKKPGKVVILRRKGKLHV